MIRAVLELVITIAAVALARAVLTSIVKGISGAARTAATGGGAAGTPPNSGSARQAPSTGVLHRDPVCGTFVADSTVYQKQLGTQHYFYCSTACRDTHRPGTA